MRRDNSIKCYDKDFLRRFLEQLDDLLTEAYYSTPPHISSKTLIKRAVELVRSLSLELESS